MKRKIMSFLTCIILSLSLVGCGASSESMFDTATKNEAAIAPGFAEDSYYPEFQ